MIFDKYQTRGAYHYQWYKDNTFGYRDCVDCVVAFCIGATLDLGGGEGLLADLLHQRNIPATTLDNDTKAIELMIERHNPQPFMWQTLYVAIEGQWEYLACLNVIEHLKKPSRVVEVFRDNITKAGIIITDKPSKTLGKYHVHEFTKKELLDLFKDYKPKYFEIGDYHGVKVYK